MVQPVRQLYDRLRRNCSGPYLQSRGIQVFRSGAHGIMLAVLLALHGVPQRRKDVSQEYAKPNTDLYGGFESNCMIDPKQRIASGANYT